MRRSLVQLVSLWVGTACPERAVESRLLLPGCSIPEALGLGDRNAQFLGHLPQRDVGSKDFERPGLAPPAQIASALAEQFPARFEHHVDIDFVPNGKLTGAQLFHVFDTLLPKLGKIIEIVKAQTASYSFECCSPGRQVVYHAVVLCPVGFPEVYERLSCDQTRKTTPVASQTGLRRTEKQIETVLGVAYLAHVPKTALDISNLAEDGSLAFHPCFQSRKSDSRWRNLGANHATACIVENTPQRRSPTLRQPR